jgi:KDO2-lipid IV(A) lauroyltransferase
MARLSHYAEYLLVRGLTSWAQSLEPEQADRLGVRLGRLAYRLLGSRRKVALENLRHAFGDTFPESERTAITRRVFENIGRTLIELSRFPLVTAEWLETAIEPHGSEILQKALDNGRGGVVVVPHFGNWELLGVYSRYWGYPVEVLVTTQHNLLVDRHLTELREKAGVAIIRAGSSVRRLFKALKENKLIAFAADQHATSGGLVVDFFGRPAAAPEGPALMAIRSGAPILPFCMRRDRFDRHVIMPGPAIYPPRSGDETADIRDMTEQYMRHFETVIRAYPDQWMWTHRRWKVAKQPQLSSQVNVKE